MDKDQCVKKHVGIIRDLLSKISKTPVFVFFHIMA